MHTWGISSLYVLEHVFVEHVTWTNSPPKNWTIASCLLHFIASHSSTRARLNASPLLHHNLGPSVSKTWLALHPRLVLQSSILVVFTFRAIPIHTVIWTSNKHTLKLITFILLSFGWTRLFPWVSFLIISSYRPFKHLQLSIIMKIIFTIFDLNLQSLWLSICNPLCLAFNVNILACQFINHTT